MTTDLIVDASVAVKWLVQEEGSDKAERLVDNGSVNLIAPDLIRYEVANAVWKNMKHRQLPEQEAWQIMDYFMNLTQLRIINSAYLVPIALRLCAALKHRSIYDCIYVAPAEHLDACMVTADKELHKKLKGTTYENHIALLTDYATH